MKTNSHIIFSIAHFDGRRIVNGVCWCISVENWLLGECASVWCIFAVSTLILESLDRQNTSFYAWNGKVVFNLLNIGRMKCKTSDQPAFGLYVAIIKCLVPFFARIFHSQQVRRSTHLLGLVHTHTLPFNSVTHKHTLPTFCVDFPNLVKCSRSGNYYKYIEYRYCTLFGSGVTSSSTY